MNDWSLIPRDVHKIWIDVRLSMASESLNKGNHNMAAHHIGVAAYYLSKLED